MFEIGSVGNKLWDKRFGAGQFDYATSLVVLPDTSLIICGLSDSSSSAVKSFPGHGGDDYWLVHYNYKPAPSATSETSSLPVSIWPNQAGDHFFIRFPSGAGRCVLNLFDATGRKVYSHSFYPESARHNQQITCSHLAPGLYFWQQSSLPETIATGKLLS